MHAHHFTTALSLALLLGGASIASAQEDYRGKRRREISAEATLEDLKRAALEDDELARELGLLDDEKAAEEIDPLAPRSGLTRFASMIVGQYPARVPPGGNGELRLIVALRGSHVIQDRAFVDPRIPEAQGKLQFNGAWELSEPRPGKVHDAFRGVPVYDDTLTVKIPFSVAADAKHGKHKVSLRPLFEISHASTRAVVGRYFGAAIGEIDVGNMPRVKRRPRPSEGDGGDAGAAPVRDEPDQPTVADSADLASASRSRSPTYAEPAQRDSDPGARPYSDPMAPAETDLTMLMFIGGVVVVGLLVLLVAKRR